MIRALIIAMALSGGFAAAGSVYAQTTGAAQPAPQGAGTAIVPQRGGTGAVPCNPRTSTTPCPPDNADREPGIDDGIYLPPLLADLLDGLRGRAIPPARQPADPGPRPPRVDGGTAPTGPAPTSVADPPVAGTPTPAQSALARIAAPAPVPPPLNRLPRTRPQAVSGAFVAGEVVAVIEGGRPVADAIAAGLDLNVLSERGSLLLGGSVVRFGIPDGRSVGLVLAQIEADGRAGRPEANHVYTLNQGEGLPQYALRRIALKADPQNGRGVKVAVIDSAVEIEHPGLAGVIVASHNAMPDLPVIDRKHGTSIVGLIAGRGAVTGSAPAAEVYHSRAFEDGQSSMDAILRSLDWSATQRVAVINMSFAGPYNRLFGLAVEAARGLGIVLVAAAGNAGPGAPRAYPAAFDSVIAVTATDTADQLMPAANRGSYVFVAAPGVDVAAPVPGGVDFLTGTSMAAAIISGGIAGLIGEDKNRGPDWIEKTLAATAIDLGVPGRDRDYGFGLANFAAARLARAR